MALTETKSKSQCLKVSLEPSGKNGMCSLAITFGDKAVTVPVSVAAKKDK